MRLEPTPENTDMQDNDQRREERRDIPSLQMNRKQRRRFAKKYGLFQDKTGEAWRVGNKHMKGDKQNRQETHRLGEES